MADLLVMMLLLLGSSSFILAAIGVMRMPDLYTRMQAAAKAVTLGIALVMIAVAIHFQTSGVTLRAVAVVAFFYLTAPISAHIIARAAYLSGIRPWHGRAAEDESVTDELRDRSIPDQREELS